MFMRGFVFIVKLTLRHKDIISIVVIKK